MNPVYSALLTSTAHLMKIGTGFVFLKLTAVYLGAEGMGLLGQFMSLVAILFLMAGGGVVNGVIKYVAEYRSEPRKLLHFLLSAKTYSLSFGIVVFIVCAVFSIEISTYVFKDDSLYWVIIFLGFAQFGFAFTNLVTGTANGLTDTKTYALIQITGNLLALPLMWILIKNYEVAGASLAVILMFVANTVPSYFFYKKSKFNNKILGIKIARGDFKKLSTYSLMALAGAISFPLVELIVRTSIIENVGYDAAGLWQASIKLSSAYMGFFIVFLSVYFMPLISAQTIKAKIGLTVIKYIKVVALLFSVGAMVFYFTRESLIPLLLSDEFLPLASVIKYQLLGDFFRVLSFVIGFVIIAKAGLTIYLISEITQGLIFCLLSLYFLEIGMGLEGVLIAHLVMNITFFGCSILGFIIYLNRNRNRNRSDHANS